MTPNTTKQSTSVLRAVFFLCATLAVSACGQKGDLYLPNQTAPVIEQGDVANPAQANHSTETSQDY